MLMNKERARVALIWGGRGHESEVSRRGKEHILPLIDQNTYDVISVFIDREGRWLLNGREIFPYRGGFYCPEGGERLSVYCAIPLLHGDFGEDGRVQGALECADIPYVGCDVSAGAICRDKAIVKMIARGLDIPTLPHLLILREEGIDYAVRRAEESFAYPMFIKPCGLGSSVGVGMAEDRSKLCSALTRALALTGRVIIEPCLTCKRELECGYFSTKSKELFTNPGEILFSGLYGYDEKYVTGEVGLAIYADLSDGVREQIREYSRRLVRALGVRDLSRIDFFLAGDRLYFNEINTMPGFTDGSLYAKMVEACGIGEEKLFSMLIENAAHRG